MIIQGNKLTADEGKILTNGETYSSEVYLGIYDSPSNWREILESEVPSEKPEQEESNEYKQALQILLGMEGDMI